MPIVDSWIGGFTIHKWTSKRKFERGGVIIHHPCLVNIYNAKIGRHTKIASFVEIGCAEVGRHCKVEAFVFIPPGTVVEDYVFIGPHVAVCNDKYPDLLRHGWKPEPVRICRGARIGANSTILPGVTVGEEAVVGAGAVVTKDIPAKKTVYGNPAVIIRKQLVVEKPQ